MTTYKNLIENLKSTEYNDVVKEIDKLLIEAVEYADKNIITSSNEKILLRFIFFRVKCPFTFLFSNKQVMLRKLARFTKKLNSDSKIMDAHENIYEQMFSVDIFFKHKENNEHNPYRDAELLKFTSFEKCLSDGADSKIGCYTEDHNGYTEDHNGYTEDHNSYNFISYNFNTKKQTVLGDRDIEDISQSIKSVDYTYGENNFITGQYFKNNQKTSKQFWAFVADIKEQVLIYDDYTNFTLFCLNRNLANIKIEDFVNPLGFFPGKAGQPTEALSIKSSQLVIFFKMQTNRGKMIQFNSGIEYKNKTDILHVPSNYSQAYIMYAWADSQGNCILFNETGKNNGFAPNDYTFMMTKRSRHTHLMLLNEYKLFYNASNPRRAGRTQSPLPSGYSPQPSGYSPQPPAGGIPTLDNVLTIYSNISGYYGNDGKGFLGKNYDYCNQIFKHNTSFRKMTNSMRIIYPDQFDKNEVMTHLKFRHPIHISGPSYSDNGNMKRYLGYSKEDALNIDKQLGPKNIRYSILGWTPLISNIAKEAYICHTWGVNLESEYTTDGQYVFSSGSGVCDDAKYFQLMGLMMCQIEAAANEVYEQTKKKVVMRVSKLGLGAWATALKVKDNVTHKNIVPDKYIERYRTLLVLMSENKPWLTIFHPDYDKKKTFKIQNNQISDNYLGHDHAANTLADPFGPPNSIPDPPNDSILLIINAWDDRSFIGNGGSTDPTLDGWIVSGSAGGNYSWDNKQIGSNFTNACYLHNSFFHPSLFTDEQKSIPIHC